MPSARALVAVAAASLCLPLSAATAAQGSAPDAAIVAKSPRPVSSPGGDGESRRGVLVDDAVRPVDRLGELARIRKWPGNKIPYYETIPAKWDWSLDQAIDHWNQAGGKIKFVEVPRAKAKLVIRYGDTGGADGVGTLGYSPSGNYVHLSPAYKKADEHDPEERVWVGRLFAHELGHVLGFNHTQGQCSLMVPVFFFGTCAVLAEGKPGYYACRWIDKKLLKTFVQMYGGKAKRPPAACLIEPLPPELRNVAFTGGNLQSKPVRITWTPPSGVRDGTKVRVTVWRGGAPCGSPDEYDDHFLVDPKSGSWTDPEFDDTTWCYRAQIENRYGATRPPSTAALPRYAPVPTAPSVGTPVFHTADGGWHVSWTPPLPYSRLEVMQNQEQPGTCVPAYDPYDASEVVGHGSGTWLVSAQAPVECLTFFTVTDWGTVSPGAQRVVEIPAGAEPMAPVVGPRTWDPVNEQFQFDWTAPHSHISLRAMRPAFDNPTTCAPGYDDDQSEFVQDDWDTGMHRVLTAYAASECIALYAVTDWGTVSPATQIVTQVPVPSEAPTVGPIGPYPDDPWSASATVTLPTSSYSVGIEVLPGTCPGVVPAGLEWSDGYHVWNTPDVYYFSTEPYGTPGQYCAVFAAVDRFQQHGPVIKRQFTIAAP